jgi:hypothetical protein
MQVDELIGIGEQSTLNSDETGKNRAMQFVTDSLPTVGAARVLQVEDVQLHSANILTPVLKMRSDFWQRRNNEFKDWR